VARGQGNKEDVVDDFLSGAPTLASFIARLEFYDGVQAELAATPQVTGPKLRLPR
jgi:hypothetical protein